MIDVQSKMTRKGTTWKTTAAVRSRIQTSLISSGRKNYNNSANYLHKHLLDHFNYLHHPCQNHHHHLYNQNTKTSVVLRLQHDHAMRSYQWNRWLSSSSSSSLLLLLLSSRHSILINEICNKHHYHLHHLAHRSVLISWIGDNTITPNCWDNQLCQLLLFSMWNATLLCQGAIWLWYKDGRKLSRLGFDVGWNWNCLDEFKE